MNTQTVGSRITLRRKMLGIGVNDLAERAKMSRRTLYYFERDLREPQVGHLRALAKELQTSVAYLIGETDVHDVSPAHHGGLTDRDIHAILSKWVRGLSQLLNTLPEIVAEFESGTRSEQNGDAVETKEISRPRFNKSKVSKQINSQREIREMAKEKLSPFPVTFDQSKRHDKLSTKAKE